MFNFYVDVERETHADTVKLFGETQRKRGKFMEKGKIIFLNGVSSSGKTTLANVLREKLDKPYFLFGVDAFLANTLSKKIDGLELYKQALSGFHHTIKLYSDMGYNVVVDHILFRIPRGMEEAVELLHDYPVLFVHVTCPIEELRRREKERGDRPIGNAENQLSELMPQDNTYDITVNTYSNSTEECADKIVALLDYPEKFTAFKTLWSQRTE